MGESGLLASVVCINKNLDKIISASFTKKKFSRSTYQVSKNSVHMYVCTCMYVLCTTRQFPSNECEECKYIWHDYYFGGQNIKSSVLLLVFHILFSCVSHNNKYVVKTYLEQRLYTSIQWRNVYTSFVC